MSKTTGWLTRSEVDATNKPVFNEYAGTTKNGMPNFNRCPKEYVSKTACKQLEFPIKDNEEPVGYVLHLGKHRYFGVYDRREESIWNKPFYRDINDIPDGYVMRSEVTITRGKRPPFTVKKKGEEPVAVWIRGSSYEVLYNRKSEKTRHKKKTVIMQMKEQSIIEEKFASELRSNSKVIMFPKKK
ncbi:hypothetical protein [Priestia megaterium]|uniref:hypothetical protein n=1 Tax=Priestia megaterium TaxID=1404 RepID=UPI003101A6D2